MASMPSAPSTVSTQATQASQITPLPSRLPPSTGSIVHDSIESAKHVTELPCARNSLLSGIASGVGVGVIRGLSVGPMAAGHWAVGTGVLISLASWHICQKQMADERKKVSQIIENMPRRTIAKQDDASNTT